MVKRNKFIQILCSLAIGILFLFAVAAFLILSGVFNLDQQRITITTISGEALYDSTTLTNHEWKITRGELKAGHKISVQFTGKQTNIGESPNSAQVMITDELGADVTDDYHITYDFGILKVNPRSIVITSQGASKLYDGFALQNPNYTISSDPYGLVEGHTAIVNVVGSITDIGETPNTIESVFIYDELGADVTSNYNLFVREGTLKITSPYGSSSMPTFDSESNLLPDKNSENAVLYSVYSDIKDTVYLKMISYGNYNGKSWSDAPTYSKLIENRYSAAYLTGLISNSLFTVHTIEIKSNYQPYALPYYTVPDHGNAQIQTSDVSYSGYIANSYTVAYVDIGDSYPQTTNKYKQFEIEYRKFVYDNYLYIDDESRQFMQEIIKNKKFSKNDKSIVNDVANYIRNAAKYDVNFPLALEYEDNVAIAFLSKYKTGLCRHYASAATLLFRALGIPARYTVGAVGRLEAEEWTNVLAKDAHAWVEVYIDGTGWVCVEVTGSSQTSSQAHDENCNCELCNKAPELFKVTLTPQTVRQSYNGKTLKATNNLLGFEYYEDLGYTYNAVVEGERSSAGITKSFITSITIFDRYHNDVTSSFDITLNEGIVHVYLYFMQYTSPSANIVYNGESAPSPYLTDGYIADGHKITIESTANTNVGIRLNTFDIVICDNDGNDVSDLYYIQKIYGTLNISPREITIKAGDAQKEFDGTPLTCHKFAIHSGTLVDGHLISMPIFVGSQTQIGRSDNIVKDISVLNSYGVDVTSNYVIKYVTGSLKVTDKNE